MTNSLSVSAQREREILMTRRFNAPRARVFDAWTKPEILTRWLYGPDDWSLAVCEVDLRVGGALRFVWRQDDGAEMGMSGVYKEIAPAERIVHTELFDEDWTGGETLVTVTLSEDAGTTTCTQTVLYSSRDVRDAVLKSPMADGLAQTYDRLDALLASIAS